MQNTRTADGTADGTAHGVLSLATLRLLRQANLRDLEDLVGKGLLVAVGAGRGAYYELPKQRLINGSIGSTKPAGTIGSETAQTAQPDAERLNTSADAKGKETTRARTKGKTKSSASSRRSVTGKDDKVTKRSGASKRTRRGGKGRGK